MHSCGRLWCHEGSVAPEEWCCTGGHGGHGDGDDRVDLWF